jgi:hypothetical protein
MNSDPLTNEPSNLHLKHLQPLIGKWNVEMTFPSASEASADSERKVRGVTTFSWLGGGAFLMMHAHSEEGGTPNSMSLIGRDESTDGCGMFYFDERGVSRIYGFDLTDGLWQMQRRSPGFFQRFVGRFSEDGKSIEAQWDKSPDGDVWEEDFKLVYRVAVDEDEALAEVPPPT